MQEINISQLIKSQGKYDLTLFNKSRIDNLEKNIYIENNNYYVTCLVRNKHVQAKPEELVQQLYLDKLINEFHYPRELLRVLHSISFGREKKQADIIILDKKDKSSVYCVIEIKKHKEREGKEQLKSYTNATGAPLAVWTNGSEINIFERKDPNYFEPISRLPKYNEEIEDIKDEKFTYLDLMKNDRLAKERKSLKNLILEMEDEVLANAGVDIFEEAFKLIFTKLYDEMESAEDRVYIERRLKEEGLHELKNEDYYRQLAFRTSARPHKTKENIYTLFQKAKEKWPGVFEKSESIKISDENHLQVCIGFLQNVKLFNSNLQVIDEAFEYLVNKSAKGEKGQYFTPRNVIDMCVYMLNPQREEKMIDTACGSCGFTIHTLFNIWKKLENKGKAEFSNFSNKELTKEQKEVVNNVFGIDFDEKAVRTSRMLNMIAGDGKTNVLHLNCLDYTRWNEKIKDETWSRTYTDGYYRLLDLAVDKKNPKEFNFDIVMANPPFAGDIKDKRLIGDYSLSIKENGKSVNSLTRDVLFIERNLDFIKDGGRMAIVLPQGRFNNTNDKRVRDFIMERARILAVVGLDVNTFKPHTGTKTSVLFVQKWHKTLNPQKDDYEIFMASSQNSGKNNSGEPMYKKKENGEYELDEHNHLIQIHDLAFIAEEFEKWAKKQKLSFWV